MICRSSHNYEPNLDKPENNSKTAAQFPKPPLCSCDTFRVCFKTITNFPLCYFTIDPADDYTYTVSFVDHNGEEHAQEFTDQFTKDTRILIAVHCTENVWTMDYDK